MLNINKNIIQYLFSCMLGAISVKNSGENKVFTVKQMCLPNQIHKCIFLCKYFIFTAEIAPNIQEREFSMASGSKWGFGIC